MTKPDDPKGRLLPAGAATVAPSQREDVAAHLIREEAGLLGALTERAAYTSDERRRIGELAARLVERARAARGQHGGLDGFLAEYGLSSEEGITLMCLAEALLRIPDADTADALIAEKVGGAHWERHLGHSTSLLVNASTFGLMLTGSVVRLGQAEGRSPLAVVKRLVARSGEPVIRQAMKQAMRILGDQFVLGRTIEAAIGRAAALEAEGYLLSYDMLGEAARTEADAARYLDRYAVAIEAVARTAGPIANDNPETLMLRPGISVKLSALDPRFEPGREARLAATLHPKLLDLARLARARGLSLTIDAEEQDRLEVTLDALEVLAHADELRGWSGLGIAVQAYGKRAVPVLRWLKRLADTTRRRIPVRLVKGAYWDSEVKLAQERGLADYPVFTSKLATDVSFLACLRHLLAEPRAFYPQIATHNAHSLAAAMVAGANTPLELQRLHGMGEALYAHVVDRQGLARRCRIYAPVGGHEDLLAYLVRRLLENGANTSFVRRLADAEAPIGEIVRDPLATAAAHYHAGTLATASTIPRPPAIYAGGRANSAGLPLTDRAVRTALLAEIEAAISSGFVAGSIVAGRVSSRDGDARAILCPHDRRQRIGRVIEADADDIERAIRLAHAAAPGWNRRGGDARARLLERAADLIERDRARLVGVIVREAGRTLEAAHAELREAVDFLRYYAGEARRHFSAPVALRGPTGERNELSLHGRGVMACIAPWNFPLAIFVGQVAAALAAGNAVIAKPAPQTPITGSLAVGLLHAAGIPVDVVNLLPGDGGIGAAIVRDPRIAGVIFTGSTATARVINRALAAREGPIVPFIAETGGINAMIADSSALPEHVVRDAVRSAFDSAGQRCSAARVLFLQSEIADKVIAMLRGAVETLVVGDPMDYATDIGPVIDAAAETTLNAHKMAMRARGREIVDLALPAACRAGSFVTPAVYEIGEIGWLEKEVFGPILHVVRYEGGHLDRVVDAINATGYGLTLGLHTRIEAVADQVAARARVGNLYVNRNQIGAVVGVQPFGGEGLSGTGPKAGGPWYVPRLAVERVRTTDTTASGGNLELLSGAMDATDV